MGDAVARHLKTVLVGTQPGGWRGIFQHLNLGFAIHPDAGLIRLVAAHLPMALAGLGEEQPDLADVVVARLAAGVGSTGRPAQSANQVRLAPAPTI